MKYRNAMLAALLCALVLAGCAPRQPAGLDTVPTLSAETLSADTQLNGVLEQWNAAAAPELVIRPAMAEDTGKRQTTVTFSPSGVSLRLTINESGLFAVYESSRLQAIRPAWEQFLRTVLPEVQADELDALWAQLESGGAQPGQLQLGDCTFSAVQTADSSGEAVYTVKTLCKSEEFLSRKLLFEPSCRRRRSPLIPAGPEE